MGPAIDVSSPALSRRSGGEEDPVRCGAREGLDQLETTARRDVLGDLDAAGQIPLALERGEVADTDDRLDLGSEYLHHLG
jgi:hypothetical protein